MPSRQTYQTQQIDVSYQAIILIALPVMLANIAVPIQSMIDTAIVGNMGNTSLVAALGIAAQVMLILLGSFNFLQASTTGLSAQLLGKLKTQQLNTHTHRADDIPPPLDHHNELTLVLIRAVLIAVVIALIFLLFRSPILYTVLPFFGATEATQLAAQEYLSIRFYGFPAELANYALFGWFAGLARTQVLLIQQLLISISNVLLSLLFVYGLNMQLDGVAIGTVISQYLGLTFALTMAYQQLTTISSTKSKAWVDTSHFWDKLLQLNEIKRLFALNSNIFIRTVLLTLSFAWITRLATQQGETFLATNVILLYILNLSAFALDGIAVSAKTLVGQTYASLQNATHTSNPLFQVAIKNTGIINALLAVGLTLLWLAIFPVFLEMMTNVESIKTTATHYKWFACLLPLAGAAAYWLDGIFFGLTDGTRIRNAMIIVALIFFPASLLLSSLYGNIGVWLAIYLFLLLRAIMLGMYLYKQYL